MAGIAAFDWSDPFNLEEQLSEEERMIRDAAHGFAQDILQPRVIEAYSSELDAPVRVGQSKRKRVTDVEFV